jgi:hypothetical protein
MTRGKGRIANQENSGTVGVGLGEAVGDEYPIGTYFSTVAMPASLLSNPPIA